MLLTDAGIISDDKNLESNLSVATTGLHIAKDFGLALTIGVVGVGLAVLIRIRRQKASWGKPEGFLGGSGRSPKVDFGWLIWG